MPDDTFKRVWNIIIIVLLIYVATYVPVSICFNQSGPGEETTLIEIIDYIVDFLFAIDIVVNFLSSYEDSQGLPVVELKQIATNYLTGWFALDVLACLPVQLIEEAFSGGGG